MKRLLFVLVFLTGCSGNTKQSSTTESSAKERAPVVVTTKSLDLRDVTRTVPIVGTLHGYDEAILSPKVEGRVIAIRADVGDIVHPGGVLLELDPADYEKDVERAKRALELELAKIDVSSLVTKNDFRPEAVPSVKRANFALENAEREFERISKTSGMSDREYRAAETELRMAKATRTMAVVEANAVLATAWLRKDELGLAELRLRDTKLCAPNPVGGEAWGAVVGAGFSPLRYRVAQRMLSEGEMVRSMPVTNAFRIVIDHELKLRASVPERHAPLVKLGQKVDIHVDAWPEKSFQGIVTRINPTVDPANRTFQIEAAVPNLDGKLKVGGFAKGSIRTHDDYAVKTTVPQAIISFAGVTKVFVIEENRAKSIPVEVGTRERDWVEILGAIPPNAQIVTGGQSQLVDGSPVRIRQSSETGKP